MKSCSFLGCSFFFELKDRIKVNMAKNQNMDWIHLRDTAMLEQLVKDSFERQVVIFKHSTRCGISSLALKRFERDLEGMPMDSTDFYLLDLLKFRNISDEIAQRFAVRHESPQLLTLRDGKLKNHASHHAIETTLLK